MTEYIEREAALEALCAPCNATVGNEVCPYRFTGCSQYYDIYNLPAADVKPVVRGEWRLYSPLFTDTYECDNCGYQVIDESFRTNFCPDCGADMRGEGDG